MLLIVEETTQQLIERRGPQFRGRIPAVDRGDAYRRFISRRLAGSLNRRDVDDRRYYLAYKGRETGDRHPAPVPWERQGKSPPIEVQATALSARPSAIAKAAAVPKRCLSPALMMVASHMMLSTDLRYDSSNHRTVG